jgi:hypothetical protein
MDSKMKNLKIELEKKTAALEAQKKLNGII